MVDKAHKNLTGADLHEPKGAASASAGMVYVANGAGSGVWTLASTFPGIFGTSFFHARDQQSSGTDGAALTSSTWNTRVMNTEVTDDIGLTLSSNQLSLVAGTYYVEIEAGSYFAGHPLRGTQNKVQSKLRLRNVTDGSTIETSQNQTFFSNDDGGGNNEDSEIVLNTKIARRFFLASTKLIEVQNYVVNSWSGPTVLAGKAMSTAEPEAYLDFKLWKTA